MELLLETDRKLLLWLNSLNAPWLDNFMFAATNTVFWTPFYLLLIYLLFKKLDHRAWLALACIAIAALISDQLTSTLLKPWTERLRPSHEPGISESLHLFDTGDGKLYRGGKFGFPSSHASNAFAIAFLVWLMVKNKIKWIGWMVFPLATLISYTRIYLGVHYVSDIIAGALLGATIGYLCSKLFGKGEQWLDQNLTEKSI